MEPSTSALVRPVPAAGEQDTPTNAGRVRVRATQQGTVYLWTLGVFSTTLWLLGENLVFLLGAFALGCGVVAWFLARRNLQGLEARRHLPARTQAGTPTRLRWRIDSRRGSTAMGLEVLDRPLRGRRESLQVFEFPSLVGGASSDCALDVVFPRRGLVDLAQREAVLLSRYPLGIFRAERSVASGGAILVRPREGRATAALRARVRGRRTEDARRRRVARGDDLIYGVREWREGDDPRRIHWRSTARRGAVVVSEWRGEQGREVLLVLGRGAGAGPLAARTFERAVSATATIWRACAREGVRARLVLGRRKDSLLGEGGRGLESGLDTLARVRAQGSRQPRRELARRAGEGQPRTVIYVGSGKEAGLEGELARTAGPGGHWLVVRADEPSLARWVRGLA